MACAWLLWVGAVLCRSERECMLHTMAVRLQLKSHHEQGEAHKTHVLGHAGGSGWGHACQ